MVLCPPALAMSLAAPCLVPNRVAPQRAGRDRRGPQGAGRASRLVASAGAGGGAPPPPTPTEVPGYTRNALLGWLPALKGDPAGFIRAYSAVNAREGHTTNLSLGVLSSLFTADPALISHVLVENAENYCKSDVDKEGVGLITGNGLLFLEGKFHRERRLQMQPFFSGSRREEEWVEGMGAVAESVVDSWRAGAGGDGAVSREVAMTQEMLRMAMLVVGSSVLQRADLTSTFADVLRALPPSLEIVIENLRSRPFAFPFWFPSAENRRLWGELETLEGAMQGVLNARLPSDVAAAALRRPNDPIEYTPAMAGVPASEFDLLDLLLLSSTEDGGRLSYREVADELKTLVLAGSETTANALAWAADFLATHPEVFARLRAEARAVVGEGEGARVRPEHIKRLAYTECVVKEVLRMRPPVWLFDRQVLGDDVLPGGVLLKKGDLVLISPLGMGADTRWHGDDVDSFRPERWAEGGSGDLPRLANIPFGAGLRSCIGQGVATLEMKVVLATMALRCESLARPPGSDPPRMDALITLRPSNEVPVVVGFSG